MSLARKYLIIRVISRSSMGIVVEGQLASGSAGGWRSGPPQARCLDNAEARAGQLQHEARASVFYPAASTAPPARRPAPPTAGAPFIAWSVARGADLTELLTLRAAP
jgi:hypothetical protein